MIGEKGIFLGKYPHILWSVLNYIIETRTIFCAVCDGQHNKDILHVFINQ